MDDDKQLAELELDDEQLSATFGGQHEDITAACSSMNLASFNLASVEM